MKKLLGWVAVSLVLAVMCLLIGGGIAYFQSRQALVSRPLVIITAPTRQSRLVVGRGLIVHAVASTRSGVTRVELWADDRLLSEREAPAEGKTTSMVISAGWMPDQPGSHVLVVRAISKDGVTGQSSVEVQVVEAGGAGAVTHVVREGETLESIAAIYGLSEEELIEMIRATGSDGPQPGDELVLPARVEETGAADEAGWSGGSAAEEGASAAETGEDAEEPPELAGERPGMAGILEFLLRLLLRLHLPSQQVELTVEVLTLETQEAYEAVHCYASLGGSDPRWVPDIDGSQATDESFASKNAGRAWGVAEHLAGEQALHLSWPERESVPVNVSCVGITGGGTDSVKLGRVQKSIALGRWGIIQNAISRGGEGQFRITYRVSQEEKGVDPEIAPPWSIRLDEEQHLLLWDYFPEEESEQAVDGFAILLNDTLQWTETASARQSRLPEQWFTLPCGDEYTFTVVAFHQGYPGGNYSLPSNPASISGGEVGGDGCGRSVVVTFQRLETGDLPGSPSPVYGVFFANEQQAGFDGRPVEGDNFPTTFGLDDHAQYTVSQIVNGFGEGEPQFVVELPPGRVGVSDLLLWIGFEIYKGGSKVCAGENTIPEERLAGHSGGTIETDSPPGFLPDWCRVTYTIDAIGERPVVEAGAPPPLPDLRVQDLSVDPATGRLRIHVRNVGQATWVEKDIVARVTWPEGEEVGVYSWPNMTLVPGQTMILSHGGLNPHPALGACVELDPDHAVEEEIDRLVEEGILGDNPRYCRPLPDLSITDVKYELETGVLMLTIQNQGEVTPLLSDADGSLDHAELPVWINFAEGRPLIRQFPDLNLGARETTVLRWELNQAERDRMREGYTVVVNPNNDIAELDASNNAYRVEGTARLRLVWNAGWATFCPSGNLLTYGENLGGKNTWHMDLYATVSGGSSRRVVADWSSPQFELTWRDKSGGGWCRGNDPFLSDWFEVAGDEELTILPTAGLDIVGHGYRWFSGGSEAVSAADGFGGTSLVPAETEESCFAHKLPYTYDLGPWIGTGACGQEICLDLSEEGIRQLGMIHVSGDEITGDCWWSTTYAIYEEEE